MTGLLQRQVTEIGGWQLSCCEYDNGRDKPFWFIVIMNKVIGVADKIMSDDGGSPTYSSLSEAQTAGMDRIKKFVEAWKNVEIAIDAYRELVKQNAPTFAFVQVNTEIQGRIDDFAELVIVNYGQIAFERYIHLLRSGATLRLEGDKLAVVVNGVVGKYFYKQEDAVHWAWGDEGFRYLFPNMKDAKLYGE